MTFNLVDIGRRSPALRGGLVRESPSAGTLGQVAFGESKTMFTSIAERLESAEQSVEQLTTVLAHEDRSEKGRGVQ